MTAPPSLQELLRRELPVSVPIGLEVRRADAGLVELAAPLAANRNPKGTAFAGSLNALATLAGWSWLRVLLETEGLAGQIVIQDSSVAYDRPVTTDFLARCPAPEAPARDRLLSTLRRRGRARVRLGITVSDREGPAVRFSGRYVVERSPASLAGGVPDDRPS